MKTILYILLFFMFLLLGCRPQEIEEPLPEYMFERFSPGQPCLDVGYIVLNFPDDSTVVISDTMSHVTKFDRFDKNEINVGFRYFDKSIDPFIPHLNGFSFSLVFGNNRREIKNIEKFFQTGSYQFYDSGTQATDPYNGGAQLIVRFHENGDYWASQKHSHHFNVSSKSGGSFMLTICGEFDLEMHYFEQDANSPNPENAIRLTGEYSITIVDGFFR